MRRKLNQFIVGGWQFIDRLRATSCESRATSHGSAGFTLTEVVVASTLLIIAIVPILKALTSAHMSTTIIKHRTHSLILAQAKLDEIKARSVYHYTDTFAQTNLSLDGSYLCNVGDSSINSNLRQITVSVGYDFNSNSTLEADEIEITLTTLVARRW